MASAARYYPRAPRYVFRPEDESLSRFAGMAKNGQPTHARVRDVSATGISFVVAAGSAPREGDMLKVEFGLPGKKQFAWFATVARVESQVEWEPTLGTRALTIVGLRFDKLPARLAKAISRAVNTGKQSAPFDTSEIEIGMKFNTTGPDGQAVTVRVIDFDEDTISVDGNHPLAGLDLTFDLRVLEVREVSMQ